MARPGASARPERPLPAWLTAWLKRRGPLSPPLALAYRQVFILPTMFGLLIGILMATMLVGSLNFNNNLGLLTTFLVAGLSLVSMFQAYRNLADIEILDVRPAPAFAGDDQLVAVTLREPGLRDRRGIRLTLGAATRSVDLGRGQARTATLEIPTHRRGWHRLGRLRVSTRYPLGLFEAWSWLMPENPALVYPAPRVPAPAWSDGGGNAGAARRQQEGEEFHSLREWRPGDPIHRIAWKASQRHGQLLSRQFRVEQDEVLVFRYDRAPGPDTEGRLSTLAAWVVQARRQALNWRLELPGQSLGPDGGDRHRHACLQALAEFT